MSSPRIVLVTPRFWPQVGDSELLIGELARELACRGASPLVLAGKWSLGWPATMRVCEFQVAHLAHAPRGGWSTLRYLIDLTRWLRRRRGNWDVVYVQGLRQEAYAAVGALQGSGVPLVLRCEESGPRGDCDWQAQTRFGERTRRRCQQADAIVAGSSAVADELRQRGYAEERVHVIPGGVEPGPPRSADRRFRARAVLSETNYDLAAAEYAPVVVYVGKLDDFAALAGLLRAWQDVARRWASARLWLIGDGSAREALYEQIVIWELQYQVFMPGSFEDLTDVWLAADVCVVPQPGPGRHTILAAMAAGLPVIAAREGNFRDLIDHDRTGMLLPAEDPKAWGMALSHFCERPLAAAEMGAVARQKVQQQFSRRAMAERHLELFAGLRDRRHSRSASCMSSLRWSGAGPRNS
jgi:glycosyltransferase involved in cell wall biosynthesis